MTLEEALERLTQRGWGGVMLWKIGEGEWNGALLSADYHHHHDTNCWDYQSTPEDVLREMVKVAERHLG